MRRAAPLLAIVLVLGLGSPAPASARGDGVKFLRIRFDPPGADNGSNTSLNNEVVIIANKSPAIANLTGWTLRDDDGHVFRFPSLILSPEEKVKIHTGSGASNARNLYWGAENYVWDNDGDTATLRQPGGRIVHGCSYSGSGSQVRCL
jgi:Lamin Tail Domain